MVKARETEEMPCTKPRDVLWWAQEKSEKEKSEKSISQWLGPLITKSLQFYFECKMNKPKSASVHKFRSLVWLKI